MKTNVMSWLAAVTCALTGAMLFRVVSVLKDIYEGFGALDHLSVPVAARAVLFVGPWGCFLFSLIGTLLIIRFRASRVTPLILIAVLLIQVSAIGALYFPGYHRGEIVSPSPSPRSTTR